jgi:cellulose synthase/poly-beta-1,6-N-acetylglucosamine synthase-like glycosyltransferase
VILVAEILFCISALAILHTYVFYPALLLLIGRNKKRSTDKNIFHPEITIVCAAYNEEKVIEEKIHSTFRSNYPVGKITMLIGTDNCSDRTVSIIQKLQLEYPQLQLREFTQRTGKIGILNILCREAQSEILVMTDANVFFAADTLDKLITHFSDDNKVLVCGRVIKRPLSGEAVTQTELRYMDLENKLKAAESNAFGVVMGAEGGCYAFRKNIFQTIPPHFIADDFFITCLALRTGKKVIFDEDALGYEDLETNSAGEFRRKARIATGNFQNLFFFKDLWLKFWTITAFCFVSHKILRWKTPFLFVLNMVTALLLYRLCIFFPIVFFGEMFLLILPLLNALLVKIGVRLRAFIAVSHFMIMNAALAVGFFRFCKGVKSSVWEPVKR